MLAATVTVSTCCASLIPLWICWAKTYPRPNTNSVLSEDTFFYRTSYAGELIDMGDTAFILAKSGYYGDDFRRTVQRHFDRLRSHPPDYILTGLCGSPELNALIGERYVLEMEGPGNLMANEFHNSLLYRRKDLIAPSNNR